MKVSKLVKTIALALSLIFVMSTVPVYAADVTPPSIVSYEIDKKLISKDESVTFTIEILDDDPKSYITLFYQRPGGVSEYINLDRVEGTCTYQGTYTVTDQSPSGKWIIDYISAYDNNGNYAFLYNEAINSYSNPKTDLSSMNFEVIGTEADIKPPTIVSYEIDKKLLSKDESVTFIVEIMDDDPKSYITLFYQRPGGVSEYISLDRVEGTGTYQGSYTVTDQSPSGEWIMDYISAGDNNDNYTYLKNEQINMYGNLKADLSSMNFEIVGTNADITPPIILSYEIDKKLVSLGECVSFTVNLMEENPSSYMTLFYQRPGGVSEYINLDRVEGTGTYQGTYTVTDQSPSGEWIIDRISAGDKNDNFSYLHNEQIKPYSNPKIDLSSMNFEVFSISDSSSSDTENHIVIFKDGFGKTISTQRVGYGQSAVEPTAPTSEMYDFSGWDCDFTAITSDLVITAQWTLKTDIEYDIEAVAGVPFEIEVFSTISQVHEITCSNDVDFTSTLSGTGIVFADQRYFSSTYEIIVNECGSYLFYVKGNHSFNTLTYKIRVSEYEEVTIPSEPNTTLPDPINTTPELITPTETTNISNDSCFDNGDVNMDGRLNIKDATAIQKHIANLIIFSDEALNLADFNSDDKVNVKDATAIQKKIAGL